MNVLSLFDGISCGAVALERTNISVDRYVASEIEPHALAIGSYNFPKKENIGDITKIDFSLYQGFELVIGGSPCQDLSNYKYDRGEVTGLEGEKSKLFYYYVKALKEINPKYFLLENVASMEQQWIDVISCELGVTPIKINSERVCAAERNRLYWTNIPIFETLVNKNIVLNDIVLNDIDVAKQYWYRNKYEITYHGSDKKVEATLHLKGHRNMKEVYNLRGKCNTILCDGNGGNRVKKVYQNGEVRRLTPIEYERLQTLPDNYTLRGNYSGEVKNVADSNRYTSVGNGWTVDVIVHIFKQMKGETK